MPASKRIALPVAAALVCVFSIVVSRDAYSFDSFQAKTASTTSSLEDGVRADMNFLAADELDGRGSATRDEHIAALFAASRFQSLGLEPGGDGGTYIQKAALPDPLP